MRVERLEKEFEIDVEWRPFELHPEIPLEGRDISGRGAERRAGYYHHLRALAEEEGLTFNPSTWVPNSHRPLEAAEFAREHGAYDSYHRALFDAHFGRGENIGDLDVLAQLAEAAGLDPAALRQALESKRYAPAVDERTEEARQSGIASTPTFIFQNGERTLPIVGAQDYNVFQSVAQRMGAKRRTEIQEPRPGAAL